MERRGLKKEWSRSTSTLGQQSSDNGSTASGSAATTRLCRSASASRRESKENKFREKISDLEDIIMNLTRELESSRQELVSTKNIFI